MRKEKQQRLLSNEEIQRVGNLRVNMQRKYIFVIDKFIRYATIPVMFLLTHDFWMWLVLVPISIAWVFIMLFFVDDSLFGDDLYKITVSIKYTRFNANEKWLQQPVNIECSYGDECIRTATVILRHAAYWTIFIGVPLYFGMHPIPHFLH